MKKLFIPIIFFLALATGFVFATGANATSITVTSPKGGETWEIGKTYNITWTSTSDVKGVIIYLANAGGAVLNTNLVNVSGNPGTASWSIPIDTPSKYNYYKILIVGCSAVNCTVGNVMGSATEIARDESDTSISIISVDPVLKNVSNINDGLGVDGYDISYQWQTLPTGVYGGDNLEFVYNDGQLIAIAYGTVQKGDYGYYIQIPWTTKLPYPNYAEKIYYKVRVVVLPDLKIESVSYKRAKSSIGGKDAINFIVIIKNDGNLNVDNSFDVAVSIAPTDEYLQGFKASEVVFGIKANESRTITVGASYLIDEKKSITFSPTLSIDVDVWTGNGSRNNLVEESNENNNSQQNLMVINPIVFIKVLSPNGGEKQQLGKSYTAIWQSSGYDTVNVSFSCENYGYGPYYNIPASAGSYIFNISTNSPTQNNCKVSVDDSAVTNISQRVAGVNSDSSDNYFSIISALSAPTLTSPSNGSTVSKGSNSSATQTFVNLSWSSVVGANLYQYKIYSSADQELYSYQTSSTSAGVGLGDGKTYKWKVRACNGTTASDSTCGQGSQQWSFATGSGLNVDLKINDSDNPPSVVYGAKIKVSWASTGATKCIPMGHSVPVEGGQPWETGLYNLPLPGGTWTLYAQHSSFGYISPLEIGIQCFDATGKSVADSINLSVNPETNISPAITVISPNDGESLMVGSQYKIKWTDNSGNPYIALALFPEPQGQLSSITIRNDVSNTGEFLWSVPSSITVGKYYLSACSLKSQSESSGLCDKSDGYFNIVSAQLNSGDLVKSPSDPTVYVIKDGKKQHITSPQEFEQSGYKWDQIKTIQSDLLKQIADLKAQISQLREELKRVGTLIKNPNGPEVYVITQDGKKQHITSPQEFSQKGYKWDQIQTVTQDEISQIPDYTSGQKVEGIYPNGTLIKSENNPTVYIIINGKKRLIPDPATFNNWGLKWDQIKEVPSGTTADFSEITISSDIVRAQGNDKIYRIIGDKKLWIPTTQAFLNSGYKPNSEIDISQDELSDFEDVKYIKAKGGAYVYEIKGDKKYRITDTSQIPAQDIKPLTLAEFTAYPIGK